MSENEAALNRIQHHKGVIGIIILNKAGTVIRTTLDDEKTERFAGLMPNLSQMARHLVRDLDPQNDLEFLRIRSNQYEIMVAPHPDFNMIVIQDPAARSD